MDCRWSRTPCSSARFRNCERPSNHSFNEDYTGNLADLFPSFSGAKMGASERERTEQRDFSHPQADRFAGAKRKEKSRPASFEMTGSVAAATNDHKNSLWWFGRFGRVELHGADDAFAFFDEDHLVRLDVLERFDEAAGPADFEEFDVFGFADAEVDTKIVLRKIAAAAAHFVNLRMQTLVAGKMRDAFDARADAAAIGFCPDGFDCDPVVGSAGITT